MKRNLNNLLQVVTLQMCDQLPKRQFMFGPVNQRCVKLECAPESQGGLAHIRTAGPYPPSLIQ